MAFARPKSLREALEIRKAGEWRILAGGTDLYAATERQVLDGNILDITGISELRAITQTDGETRIGAGATWSEFANSDLAPAFDGLKAAAREVGSIQIQNAATVVGNICNASPAADGVPPLLTLNAVVELVAGERRHRVPLGEFIVGNRQIRLPDDAIVTAIIVPDPPSSARGAFVKLGARHSLVISICMAAVVASVAHGKVASIAISVGASSAVARRMPQLELAMTGRSVQAALSMIEREVVANALDPIDDIRASAVYRREVAAELIRRAMVLLPDFKAVAA